VFQHRHPGKHISEAHIGQLAKVPQQGRSLDPILVWWDGSGWTCVDGHHRIEAYRHAGNPNPVVPVQVFKEDLPAALARAAESNSHDKLMMSPREKTEAAWRLTLAPARLSIAQVAGASGASRRSVAYMREVKAELHRRFPENDLSELSWNDARMKARGEEREDTDWDAQVEREAQQFADVLSRHLGTRGRQRKESLARALELYDAQLPSFLIEAWREKIEEWQESNEQYEELEHDL
jgi:hypothetical protein